MPEPLLEVKDLHVYFYVPEGTVRAVRGVSWDLQPGETLGLVGESGCGKSVTALSLLRLIPNPPGRMEKCIKLNNNAKVFVDYAHTPDALKNILLSSIIFNNQKSNILFGCGGNRDKSKRQIMGRIAKKYAEKIYLTDDNPRNEKPEKIISSIFKGCPEAKKISGRKKAIAIAIKELKRNETLIIAGKGDEKFQIIGNKKIPFDDIKLANSFIKKLNNEKVKY